MLFSLSFIIYFTYIMNIFSLFFDDLKGHEVAIVQFDSRPLRDYWLTSSLWNHHYASLHGHLFLYYNLKDDCHYLDTKLAQPWCKVKTMIQADEEYPEVKVFIYMDSDAVISKEYENTSLNSFLQLMLKKLDWSPREKPIVFNQDGPCWWCNLIQKAGYHMCLNAGTVLWYRHDNSRRLLEEWWHSTMESYSDNPLHRKFRTSWPWEQDRQMALFHRSPEHIQIASHPNSSMLFADSYTGNLISSDWCLSHLPGYGCLITHFCANPKSKQRLRTLYRLPGALQNETEYLSDPSLLPFVVHELRY